MDFFEVIDARRSVRSFRTEAVPWESITEMIAAASKAPSAMDEQPWRFYVATGQTRRRLGEVMAQGTIYLKEYLDTIGPDGHAEAAQWYSELGHAPVLIACTMPIVDDELSRLNTHLSIGAAIENMSLAATAQGLGTCIITFSFWVRDELANALNVPDDRTIAAIVAVGYPEDEQPEHPARETDVVVYLK